MKTILALALTGVFTAAAGAQESALYSPGFASSAVDASGGLVEDWGRIAVCLDQPKVSAVQQQYLRAPVPTVVTTLTAGSIMVTETAYRAPIWPRGVDVLYVQAVNQGEQAADLRIAVEAPDALHIGGRVGMLNGRAVWAMPKDIDPVREEQAWGNTGGLTPLPGWARPEGECDPGFRNICAGMGGVPIQYRFTVPVGAARTVAMGFCESHWDGPGKRPLIAQVEGAPDQEIDPIAAWGRHVPGVLLFSGKDENQNGWIEVMVSSHPRAEDKNPILNVLWIFKPEIAVDSVQMVRGALNSAAEYYVDAGGEKDQLLYKNNKVFYAQRLDSGAVQEWLFLAACSGGGSVPDPRTMVWNASSLRAAAEAVWAGWSESAL